MATRLVKVKQWKPITISIPDDLLEQFEKVRGDVSRSKYIKRLIEEHLTLMNLHMDNPFLTT